MHFVFVISEPNKVLSHNYFDWHQLSIYVLVLVTCEDLPSTTRPHSRGLRSPADCKCFFNLQCLSVLRSGSILVACVSSSVPTGWHCNLLRCGPYQMPYLILFHIWLIAKHRLVTFTMEHSNAVIWCLSVEILLFLQPSKMTETSDVQEQPCRRHDTIKLDKISHYFDDSRFMISSREIWLPIMITIPECSLPINVNYPRMFTSIMATIPELVHT